MFTLKIRTANEAMLAPGAVAQALQRVARQVQDGRDSGSIYDLNGNTVGEFVWTEDES